MESIFEFTNLTSYEDCLLFVKYQDRVSRIKFLLFLSNFIFISFLNFIFYLLGLLPLWLYLFFIEVILIIGSLIIFHSLAARTLLKKFNNNSNTVKYYLNYYENCEGKRIEYTKINGYFKSTHLIFFHSGKLGNNFSVGFAKDNNIVKGNYEEFLQFINKKIEESGAKQIIL